MPTPERARSPAEMVAWMGKAERDAFLAALPRGTVEGLAHRWPFWRRADQVPPAGRWSRWLVMAGRGFGKTRLGAEWVRELAMRRRPRRIALVAATMAEARAVMVEGPSGVLAVHAAHERPRWEPSLGRLSWASGTVATLFSAAEPESLRGPEHHLAWADEIAKWQDGEAAWDNLEFGLRLGHVPRVLATTTPRPVPLVKRLLGRAAAGGDTVVTRGRTHANRAHLAAGFIARVEESYGGTRLGRQELDGELIEDVEGALWTRALIERCRVPAPEEGAIRRVVVAVDPPAGIGGDACGIVAAVRTADGRAAVIADASVEGLGPEGWARAVADCARAHGADRVVAEANNGGAMVESVLRAAAAGLPVRLVHASRGKAARAEPVAALFAAGRAGLAGAFPRLEDELCGLVAGGGYEGPGRSPDRADALVWALTELMLGAVVAEPAVRGL